MRLAILISLAASGWAFSAARADDSLLQVALDSGPAYIVPESYAVAHKAEMTTSIPTRVKIDGFWTPSEVDVIVADRVFRELIQDATKEPTLLFPDLAPGADSTVPEKIAQAAQLENERYELSLVSSHFDQYARQYAGIIVDGQRFVFCNYAVVPKVDPSARYLCIEKVFVADGTVHFLQSRFDPDAKTCSHVSLFGSWQKPAK